MSKTLLAAALLLVLLGSVIPKTGAQHGIFVASGPVQSCIMPSAFV